MMKTKKRTERRKKANGADDFRKKTNKRNPFEYALPMKIDVDDMIRRMARGDPAKLRLMDLVKQQLDTIDRSPDHPVYYVMIREAITALNEKEGSTREAISDFIVKKYDVLPVVHLPKLIEQLEKLVNSQELALTPLDRYMLLDDDAIPGAEVKPVDQNSRMDEQDDRSYKHCMVEGDQIQENHNVIEKEPIKVISEERQEASEYFKENEERNKIFEGSQYDTVNSPPGFDVEGVENQSHLQEEQILKKRKHKNGDQKFQTHEWQQTSIEEASCDQYVKRVYDEIHLEETQDPMEETEAAKKLSQVNSKTGAAHLYEDDRSYEHCMVEGDQMQEDHNVIHEEQCQSQIQLERTPSLQIEGSVTQNHLQEEQIKVILGRRKESIEIFMQDEERNKIFEGSNNDTANEPPEFEIESVKNQTHLQEEETLEKRKHETCDEKFQTNEGQHTHIEEASCEQFVKGVNDEIHLEETRNHVEETEATKELSQVNGKALSIEYKTGATLQYGDDRSHKHCMDEEGDQIQEDHSVINEEQCESRIQLERTPSLQMEGSVSQNDLQEEHIKVISEGRQEVIENFKENEEQNKTFEGSQNVTVNYTPGLESEGVENQSHLQGDKILKKKKNEADDQKFQTNEGQQKNTEEALCEKYVKDVNDEIHLEETQDHMEETEATKEPSQAEGQALSMEDKTGDAHQMDHIGLLSSSILSKEKFVDLWKRKKLLEQELREIIDYLSAEDLPEHDISLLMTRTSHSVVHESDRQRDSHSVDSLTESMQHLHNHQIGHHNLKGTSEVGTTALGESVWKQTKQVNIIDSAEALKSQLKSVVASSDLLLMNLEQRTMEKWQFLSNSQCFLGLSNPEKPSESQLVASSLHAPLDSHVLELEQQPELPRTIMKETLAPLNLENLELELKQRSDIPKQKITLENGISDIDEEITTSQINIDAEQDKQQEKLHCQISEDTLYIDPKLQVQDRSKVFAMTVEQVPAEKTLQDVKPMKFRLKLKNHQHLEISSEERRLEVELTTVKSSEEQQEQAISFDEVEIHKNKLHKEQQVKILDEERPTEVETNGIEEQHQMKQQLQPQRQCLCGTESDGIAAILDHQLQNRDDHSEPEEIIVSQEKSCGMGKQSQRVLPSQMQLRPRGPRLPESAPTGSTDIGDYLTIYSLKKLEEKKKSKPHMDKRSQEGNPDKLEAVSWLQEQELDNLDQHKQIKCHPAAATSDEVQISEISAQNERSEKLDDLFRLQEQELDNPGPHELLKCHPAEITTFDEFQIPENSANMRPEEIEDNVICGLSPPGETTEKPPLPEYIREKKDKPLQKCRGRPPKLQSTIGKPKVVILHRGRPPMNKESGELTMGKLHPDYQNHSVQLPRKDNRGRPPKFKTPPEKPVDSMSPLWLQHKTKRQEQQSQEQGQEQPPESISASATPKVTLLSSKQPHYANQGRITRARALAAEATMSSLSPQAPGTATPTRMSGQKRFRE